MYDMRVYLSNGKSIRISKTEASLIADIIFTESDKHEYLRITRDKKTIGLFKLADIIAIK